MKRNPAEMLISLCCLLLCFPLSSLGADVALPAGTLSGDEIKDRFSGMTVAASSAAGKDQELVIYFAPDGKVRQAKKGWLKMGKWYVRDDNRLCIDLKGADRDCRIIVKQGADYRQYAVKLDGQHQHELTYLEFRAGLHLAQMSAAPILPQATLDEAQVVELFSGKTVESVTAAQGRISHSYYAPDGRVEQTRNGVKRFGTWRVTRNGRICLQMENLPEKCRIIVKEGDGYKKYIVRKNGQHQHSVSYRRFKAGNLLR